LKGPTADNTWQLMAIYSYKSEENMYAETSANKQRYLMPHISSNDAIF
jgi:hypothetical protein